MRLFRQTSLIDTIFLIHVLGCRVTCEMNALYSNLLEAINFVDHRLFISKLNYSKVDVALLSLFKLVVISPKFSVFSEISQQGYLSSQFIFIFVDLVVIFFYHRRHLGRSMQVHLTPPPLTDNNWKQKTNYFALLE